MLVKIREHSADIGLDGRMKSVNQDLKVDTWISWVQVGPSEHGIGFSDSEKAVKLLNTWITMNISGKANHWGVNYCMQSELLQTCEHWEIDFANNERVINEDAKLKEW